MQRLSCNGLLATTDFDVHLHYAGNAEIIMYTVCWRPLTLMSTFIMHVMQRLSCNGLLTTTDAPRPSPPSLFFQHREAWDTNGNRLWPRTWRFGFRPDLTSAADWRTVSINRQSVNQTENKMYLYIHELFLLSSLLFSAAFELESSMKSTLLYCRRHSHQSGWCNLKQNEAWSAWVQPTVTWLMAPILFPVSLFTATGKAAVHVSRIGNRWRVSPHSLFTLVLCVVFSAKSLSDYACFLFRTNALSTPLRNLTARKETSVNVKRFLVLWHLSGICPRQQWH